MKGKRFKSVAALLGSVLLSGILLCQPAPAEELVEQPAKILVEQPAEELVEKPAETKVEQPAEELVEQQAEAIVEAPAETKVEQPAETTESKSMEALAGVAEEKPMETLAGEPAEGQAQKKPVIGPIDIRSITKYVERDGWSYDPATKTLVLAGVNIDAYADGGYSYTENPEHKGLEWGDIPNLFSIEPGTTIIVKEGTVNNLQARLSSGTFVCTKEGDPITIKGGGTLNLNFNEIAIYSYTDVNIEDVTITLTDGDIFAMLVSGSNKTHKNITFTMDKCNLTVDNCTGGIYNYGTVSSGKNLNDAFSKLVEYGFSTASVKIKDSNIKMNIKLDTSHERNHSCFLIRNGYLDIDNSTLDLNSYHEAVNVWKSFQSGAGDESLIRLNDVKLPDDVEIASDILKADAGFIKGETFVKKGDRLELSFDKVTDGMTSSAVDLSFAHKFKNGLKSLTMNGTREIETGTPVITLSEAEKVITTADTDKDDVAGSCFSRLFLRAKAGKNKITLTWKKVPEADSYVIFGSKCGKKMEKITTVTDTRYVAGKLKKGTYYKYTVLAVKGSEVISTAKTVHCITNGGKKGNPEKIICKKKKITIRSKKAKKINAKIKAKKKVSRHTSPIRYESSNPAVATVSKKGKVKAVSAGTCTVYLYAQNGICKSVKVTVK